MLKKPLLTLALSLTLLPTALEAAAPREWSYRVMEKQPQPRDHFVQGLQIVDGMLYVSTGGYGSSRLLQYRLADGELLRVRRLHPRLFGEGLTVLGEQVYQLTWRARRLLVFQREGLTPKTTLPLPGQGWGLTDNGRELIYTDSGHELIYLDPDSGRELRRVPVRENGTPLPRLNELEWIDGKVWANIWQEDRIVAIEPDTGRVTDSVNLAGLLPDSERGPGTDVLNGIAHNPVDGALWVTGKRWPWRYRIELVPAKAAGDESR
ncbi:MAG: glutamine cyclotransferase [Haliea sp.]|nr:glutamine cyclotransferase [Haliea sp.]|tara:strand:- start:77111 stop:77902 length:792 start_codon:yes stop_codon:yes gene_type:complete